MFSQYSFHVPSFTQLSSHKNIKSLPSRPDQHDCVSVSLLSEQHLFIVETLY